MLEVVIFIGLQASGKSSFYQAIFSKTHAWISKDKMRNHKNRDRRQLYLLNEALASGQSVVIDNTNPTIADRIPLIETGKLYNATIIGYQFESILGECLNRNQQRIGKARIPDVGLYATYKKLVFPTFTEGFDQLFQVKLLEHHQFEQIALT